MTEFGTRYATAVTKLRTLSPAFDWRAAKIDWPVTTDVGPGLAGVVAAETRVMWLDPSSGQLAYRGVPIDVLANQADFEEVSHLLISGKSPDDDPDGLADFRQQVRSSRSLPTRPSRGSAGSRPQPRSCGGRRTGWSAAAAAS